VKTYLQESRTFPANLSTEVLEKEAGRNKKENAKVLKHKEKVGKSPKMGYHTRMSTEARLVRNADRYRGPANTFSCGNLMEISGNPPLANRGGEIASWPDTAVPSEVPPP
jgi:hypothetical protein